MEEFYKKKVIRDFLSQFSESKWKSLTILCIEYGILQLKNNHAVSSLSLEDIENFVDELKEEDIKRQRKNLKQKFSKNNTEGNCSINSKSNQSNSNNIGRPSANWRKGDTKTIFDYKNAPLINNTATNNDQQKTINDYSLISKNSISREKMLDEILYPKKDKIVNYYKDNIQLGLGNNNRRKKRSTSTSFLKKGMGTSSSYSNYSTLHNNTNTYTNTQGNYNNNNPKFNSGLQKLQMRKRTETPNPNSNSTFNDYHNNDNNNRIINKNTKGQQLTSNLQPKFTNVQSRIKSQVEIDKKIYGMLKNKQHNEKDSSIITDRRSEMSFEEGFSSLV